MINTLPIFPLMNSTKKEFSKPYPRLSTLTSPSGFLELFCFIAIK
tara:strand:- start:361 stop:495 length:135 start_codon:yes stop_codon:yes gene_type:complete